MRLENRAQWGKAPAALAAYKAPRNLVLVDTIGRAANGKVDYERLKVAATERLGAR